MFKIHHLIAFVYVFNSQCYFQYVQSCVCHCWLSVTIFYDISCDFCSLFQDISVSSVGKIINKYVKSLYFQSSSIDAFRFHHRVIKPVYRYPKEKNNNNIPLHADISYSCCLPQPLLTLPFTNHINITSILHIFHHYHTYFFLPHNHHLHFLDVTISSMHTPRSTSLALTSYHIHAALVILQTCATVPSTQVIFPSFLYRIFSVHATHVSYRMCS